MQTLFLAAGSLAMITGIVHSVLGEILIFRHLRKGGLVPSMAVPPLRERNIRILWATWHLGSVFGWAFAGVLLRLAMAPQDSSLTAFTLNAIVFANLGGSLLVLVGTKGRHPGWIALLAVAVFTWLAANGS
jgi:drug/metabolite transporter (DMT)-like permease